MNLYALGPLVAGNFHRNRYSGAVTDKFICQASRYVINLPQKILHFLESV